MDVGLQDAFWAQYKPNKSVYELLDRKKYQESHDNKAQTAREECKLKVDTFISAKLEEIAPDEAEDVNADHLKVVHLTLSTDIWSADESTGQQIFKYRMSDSFDGLENTSTRGAIEQSSA